MEDYYKSGRMLVNLATAVGKHSLGRKFFFYTHFFLQVD